MVTSRLRPLIWAALLGAGLSLPPMESPRASTEPEAAPQAGFACLREAIKAERAHDIPAGLLAAIAAIESGRPGSGRGGGLSPWPWTINDRGQGRYFDSKEEAEAEVARLLQEGVAHVDVGCMGINLFHHPDAFQSLSDAFDPAANVDYAARFLRRLYTEFGNWKAAVATYHNADPEIGGAYRARVFAAWEQGTHDPLEVAAQAMADGDAATALVLYRDAMNRRPEDRTALRGTAAALDRLGRRTEARSAYERLLLVHPDDEVATVWLLEDMEALPEEDRLERLRVLAAFAPDSPYFPARIAAIHYSRGQLHEALALMKRAAGLDPRNAVYRLNVGLLYDRLGQPNEALPHYEAFLAAHGENAPPPGVSIETVRQRLRHLKETARPPSGGN